MLQLREVRSKLRSQCDWVSFCHGDMHTSWSSSYSIPGSVDYLHARVNQNLSEYLVRAAHRVSLLRITKHHFGNLMSCVSFYSVSFCNVSLYNVSLYYVSFYNVSFYNVSFYNVLFYSITAPAWTFASPRTTWESMSTKSYECYYMY